MDGQPVFDDQGQRIPSKQAYKKFQKAQQQKAQRKEGKAQAKADGAAAKVRSGAVWRMACRHKHKAPGPSQR